MGSVTAPVSFNSDWPFSYQICVGNLLSGTNLRTRGRPLCPAAFVVEHSPSSGVAIILVAGLLSGVFVLPTSGVRDWEWEHMWLVYSISAFLVVPLGLAALLSPRIFSA